MSDLDLVYEPLTHSDFILGIMRRAVYLFNASDSRDLLRPGDKNLGGPNEPAISTQLIVRLTEALREKKVPDFVRVVGPYNRFGGDEKFLYKMEQYRAEIDAAKRELRLDGSLKIVPDIIIHEYGAPGPNYLVIEVKKDSNADEGLVKLDRIKLSCMTNPDRPLHYVLGAEIRAHDVDDEATRKLEILSLWKDGKSIPLN